MGAFLGALAKRELAKKIGNKSASRAAAGAAGTGGSTLGQDIEDTAKNRLMRGGKRPDANVGQFSVGSMGLAGSIPGQSSDEDFSGARRKRSNGKDRG